MCQRQPELGLPVALCDIIQIAYLLPDTRCLSQIAVVRPREIRNVEALFVHVLDILRDMDGKDLQLAVSRNRVRFIVSRPTLGNALFSSHPSCFFPGLSCPLDRLPITLRCLIWMLHSHFQQWHSFPTSRFPIKGQD